MFILFGQNIGTCLTSLVASSGTGTAARRTAVVHLLINLSGTILFTVITASLPFADWVTAMAPGNLRLQIALTHIIFNITTTLLLLLLAGLLEKAACLLVPDKDSAEMRMRLRFDDRMLNTPAIAVVQLFRETQRMGDMARQNLEDAMQCFTQYDAELSAHVQETEDVIDFLNRAITAKLVEVNGLDLNEADTRLVGSMFHVVSDFERVGDHAENVLDSARTREEEGIRFSAKVMSELEDLYGKVLGQLKTAQEIFRSQTVNLSLIDQVEAVEDDIDNETEELRKHHVERLKNRKCSARNGALYLDMLTNLERIADHAENIATSVDKPA